MIHLIIKNRPSQWHKAPVLVILFSIIIGYLPIKLFAEEAGKNVFQTNCAVCHTIGAGRLVGPDLIGVNQKRSQEWLQNFVKSSQAVIASGDKEAVALFTEYNSMPMPDAAISDQQIEQVLHYIKSATEKIRDTAVETDTKEIVIPEKAVPVVATLQKPANDDEIILGQNIFQGLQRLSNGGPACNACHEVKNDAVIGGGILARELTSVFSRMGGPAVRSILGSAPFPVMKAAYLNKPLSQKEIAALVAFFQVTDQERAYQQPRDYGMGLLISGVIGAGLLLVFYSLLWSQRKKNSVNQSIYDRQVKSQ